MLAFFIQSGVSALNLTFPSSAYSFDHLPVRVQCRCSINQSIKKFLRWPK